MKTNREIRAYLERRGSPKGGLIEDIRIHEEERGRGRPYAFVVSYKHTPTGGDAQYWGAEFGIRSISGKPTGLGKMMGITGKDKRISAESQKGREIHTFLQRVAWLYACGITNDRANIAGKPLSKREDGQAELAA